MITPATIKAIYQKRQAGKGVNIREIKYNVYNHIKSEELDITINWKENTFLTSFANIYVEFIDMCGLIGMEMTVY